MRRHEHDAPALEERAALLANKDHIDLAYLREAGLLNNTFIPENSPVPLSAWLPLGIGLVGPPDAGKTTAATIVQATHETVGFIPEKISFIREQLQRELNHDPSQDPTMLAERLKITHENTGEVPLQVRSLHQQGAAAVLVENDPSGTITFQQSLRRAHSLHQPLFEYWNPRALLGNGPQSINYGLIFCFAEAQIALMRNRKKHADDLIPTIGLPEMMRVKLHETYLEMFAQRIRKTTPYPVTGLDFSGEDPDKNAELLYKAVDDIAQYYNIPVD